MEPYDVIVNQPVVIDNVSTAKLLQNIKRHFSFNLPLSNDSLVL